MSSNLQTNRRPSFHLGRAGTVWLTVCLAAALLFSWRGISRSDESLSKQLRLTPISLAGAAERGDGATRPLKDIEQIQVGERVALAENPAEPFDDSLGADVDPATWRMIRLRVDEQSGGQANVVLLRPQWWINERLDPDGQLLTLSVPEVGIHDNAEVLGVEPCPPISGGRGRVVIGTFAHSAPTLVALHVACRRFGRANSLHTRPPHLVARQRRIHQSPRFQARRTSAR